MTSGQFKPLPEILMEMAPAQQEQLYSDVMAILGTLKWTDVPQLIAQVNGNATLHEQVLGAILNYTKNQLKADVRLISQTESNFNKRKRQCLNTQHNEPSNRRCGALGGAMGWWMTSDKFQPLHQIIMEMPPQQKRKLYSEVMAVLGNLDWVDLAQLIFLVMGNSSLQMRVLTTLISFATKELGAKVEYGQT
ncbi:hypothetical protein G5714_007928 [Onychostoma macrolepis]|uniref:Uncharacterized protein n=1 Tax=Onychostoma macrolepis TaxID=369639 RepID=A0A7J6CU66_9TELE|nr:hypothetical protein G5714_007928 [Onychostoma macrolepis]